MYERIDMLVNWFVKFDLDFACMYFDQPDSDGHSYGKKNSIVYIFILLKTDTFF